MPPEETEVQKWISKAEQDRSAARRLFSPQGLEMGVIAFLCQQAVEKLLKAFLNKHSREIEKTHDIGFPDQPLRRD